MKGFNDFSIGDSFTLSEGETIITIKDYIVKQLHTKRNDYRTKLVDTVIWCLFADDGSEYRKTSDELNFWIKSGWAMPMRRAG
jgi:hypothetical protein